MKLANVLFEPEAIGGLGSLYLFPSLKLGMDMGFCNTNSVHKADTVLFSHGHMDHVAGAPEHCARRNLMGISPPTYVMGPEMAPAFQSVFDSYRALDKSELPYNLEVISPGDEYRLNKHVVVRPFRSYHRVPCQGYALVRSKQKLEAGYHGMPGREIGALRAKGVEVSDIIEYPEVVYTGDTLIDVVEREEVVRKARLLIMEVTFLDDRVNVEQARSMGHIHLDEVVERADLFENEAILFTHFSARYRHHEILAILKEKLPESLASRVTPLLCKPR